MYWRKLTGCKDRGCCCWVGWMSWEGYQERSLEQVPFGLKPFRTMLTPWTSVFSMGTYLHRSWCICQWPFFCLQDSWVCMVFISFFSLWRHSAFIFVFWDRYFILLIDSVSFFSKPVLLSFYEDGFLLHNFISMHAFFPYEWWAL